MTASTNALKQPVIYTQADFDSFLLHVVKWHTSPTTIIVCSDRQVFLEQVISSISRPTDHHVGTGTETDSERQQAPEVTNNDTTARILSRTILFLSSSRTVALKFCNSLSTLQALLSSISPRPAVTQEHASPNKESKTAILGIINPVVLHRETASYSAQGLSKTFAAAVEASCRSGQRLMVVECPSIPSQVHVPGDNEDHVARPRLQADGDVEMNFPDVANANTTTAHDPWEEKIPILNATTKAIGTAGDRAWLGRTVSVKDVAKRWFIFEPLQGN